MFSKTIMVMVLMHAGLALAQGVHCEKMLSPEEFYKVDFKSCIEIEKKNEKVLSVDDSLRESGKEIINNRAPSVEVMYKKSTRQ